MGNQLINNEDYINNYTFSDLSLNKGNAIKNCTHLDSSNIFSKYSNYKLPKDSLNVNLSYKNIKYVLIQNNTANNSNLLNNSKSIMIKNNESVLFKFIDDGESNDNETLVVLRDITNSPYFLPEDIIISNHNLLQYVNYNLQFPEIIIDNITLSKADYLYLLCNLIQSTGYYYYSYNYLDVISSYSSTCYGCSMTKEEYINFAFNICSVYVTYNQPSPTFVSEMGNLTFEDSLYFYMNILDYVYQYGTLPESQEVLDYLNAYRVSVNTIDDFYYYSENNQGKTTLVINVGENVYYPNRTVCFDYVNVIIFANNHVFNVCNCSYNFFYINDDQKVTINEIVLCSNNYCNPPVIFNNGVLLINNCTIRNFNSHNSTSIYNAGRLHLFDTKLYENNANRGCIIRNDGVCLIDTCILNNNVADHAIINNLYEMEIFNSEFEFNNGSYSIIYNDLSLFLNNVTFNNERSQNSLIWNNNSMDIRKSNFNNNKVFMELIRNWGNASICYSAFDNNFVVGNSLFVNDMGTFLIGYNKFTNNWGNVSSIVLNNGFLDFGYNQIYNSFSKYSGIFYFDSGLASVYGNDMINITFSKSGILYNINSNVSFINNYIEQNNFSAVETNDTNNYVGAFCNFGNLILLNNTIKKITGNYFGIILNNNLTILNNNLITNNNATFGGVIYNNASLYLKRNLIANNTAEYGIIYNNENGSATIEKNNFWNNSAYDGSVIFNYGGFINVTNNNFHNNTAKHTGIITTTNGSSLYSNNNTYFNNKAQFGAAFYSSNATVVMVNDTIKYNLADEGGAVYTNDSTLIINNCTISNNTVIKSGGAIHSNTSLIDINNSRIYNNFAKYGAGISLEYNDVIRINNTLFTNNNATYSGGAIKSENSSIIINNTNITKNNAINGVGGAIYSLNTELYIYTSNFTSNKATSGGAITQLSKDYTTILNSNFTKNQATENDGGALYFVYGTVLINSTNFTNNSANNKAGVINSRYNTLLAIAYSTFEDNMADNGKILNSYKSTISLNDNIILSSNNENIIYINNSSYNLDSNWWGINNPNFTVVTNNITPNNWRILTLSCNQSNTYLNLYNLSLNTLNTLNTTTTYLPTRKLNIISETYNDSATFNNSIDIVLNSIITNVTFNVDNQNLSFINKVEPTIIINNSYIAQKGNDFKFIIKINTNQGKITMKLNGITLKDENGSVIYANIINNTVIFNHTLSNTYQKTYYNVSVVYSGSSNYLSSRVNYTLYLKSPAKNYINTNNTILNKKIEPLLEVNDSIVTPGAIITINATMNEDITDNIKVKINGITYNKQIINGCLSFNYTVPSVNKNLLNVTFSFAGNDVYLPKNMSVKLYSQTDNESFDMNDYGLVTSIKNQGESVKCWAFASLGTLESAILKKQGITRNFSENYLNNAVNMYSINEINQDLSGGNSLLRTINAIISGKTLINEDDDLFDEQGTISPELNNTLIISDVKAMIYTHNFSQISEIKKMILKYGAVLTDCYFENSYDDNSNNNILTLYSHNYTTPNHAIMLVGWDDNYDKYNFNNNHSLCPEGNGAFIVKNSWGSNQGYNGFNYISYYDKSLGGFNVTGWNMYSFDLDNNENYTTIYQNEISSTKSLNLNNSSTLWIKNNYQAKNNETLKAVGTYFQQETSYTIYLYKNGLLLSNQSGFINYTGYKSIPLTTWVHLDEYDNFTVVLKVNTTNVCEVFTQDALDRIFDSEHKLSYISLDGENWIDLANYNLIASIKVYSFNLNYNCYLNTSLNLTTLRLKLSKHSKLVGNITYYVNDELIGQYDNISTTSHIVYHELDQNSTNNISIKVVLQTVNYTYTIGQLLNPNNNTQTILNYSIPNYIYDNYDFDNSTIDLINYTSVIPCYVNVTLPNVVSEEGDPYNIYIRQEGINGTVIVPMQKIINITVSGVNYTFTNIQDNNIQYNLKQASYFIPLNGSSIIQCTHSYIPNVNGILLMYQNNNIIVKYYYNLKTEINQFVVISNTTTAPNYNLRVPRNNESMYVTLLRYNLNGITTAIACYTEGMLYDESGLKHQLYIQGIIDNPTDYYNYQSAGIHYANTNELVMYDENTHRIIREKYIENITSIFTCDNSSVTRNEEFRYGIIGVTNALQSYSIVKSKVTLELFNYWLNKTYPNATTIMKNMFLVGLEEIYFNDVYADMVANMTNTTWNRLTNTIVMTGLNNDTAYLHTLDNLLGMDVQGDNESIYTFRFFTTMGLSTIETKVLNRLANISSPIINLLDSINNDDYQIIENASNIIVISGDQQSILVFDTEKGIVTDYLYSDGNVYHGLLSDDPSRTSFLNFEVGSPEAEAQNLAGQIIINVGGYACNFGPWGIAAGGGLVCIGTLICADANGCFSMDGTNMTRVIKTGVDVGSNLPYAKFFSGVAGKLSKLGLTDKIVEGFGDLTLHADNIYNYAEHGLQGFVTFAGELYIQNATGQSLFGIMVDSMVNILPLRTFSKLYTEVPYDLGKFLFKTSEKSNMYVKEIFGMLDDYDKESLLFVALLGHNFQKSLFLTINMYDTTVNVLVKNYFKSVFIKLFDVSDESFLNQIRNDSGFIYMSKESYYLATNNDSLSNVVFEKDVLL